MSTTSTTNLDNNLKTPSAPVLEKVEMDATVTKKEPNQFEWNVERLFAHDPKHSLGRTFAVRILSLFIGIPTLILDLGRRLAFAVGLSNGKSFSLIDGASEACKAIAAKVSALFKPKELSLEEKNAISKKNIESHVQKLVNSYERLSAEPRFSTNSAHNAEKTILAEQNALTEEVKKYVLNNCEKAENFAETQLDAQIIVQKAIETAAGDKIFIANKVKRSGPQAKLCDVVSKELLSAIRQAPMSEEMITIAKNAKDFAAALKTGVNNAILTKSQAKEAVQAHAQTIYADGLEEGVKKADEKLNTFLDSAVKNDIVNQNEVESIQIQPSIELLAKAAARDAVKESPKADENEIKNSLIRISDKLKEEKKLPETKISTFNAIADAHVEAAKEEIKIQEAEQESIRAQEAAALEKKAAQENLLNQFKGMLGLIEEKQNGLSNQYKEFAEMETQRKASAGILSDEAYKELLRKTKEDMQKMAKIAASDTLNPDKRQKKFDDVIAGSEASKAMIENINEKEKLAPTLQELFNKQSKLFIDIDQRHIELATLYAQYNVFKSNNRKNLESKDEIAGLTKTVRGNKEALRKSHDEFFVHSLWQAFKNFVLGTPVKVSDDVETNRQEVEALVAAFRKSKEEKPAKTEAPAPVLTTPVETKTEAPAPVEKLTELNSQDRLLQFKAEQSEKLKKKYPLLFQFSQNRRGEKQSQLSLAQKLWNGYEQMNYDLHEAHLV